MKHDFIWGQDQHVTFQAAIKYALFKAHETGRRQRVFKSIPARNIYDQLLPWISEEVSTVRVRFE